MAFLRVKIIALFLVVSGILFGQEADSLIEVYKAYPNDTAKVNLLHEKSYDLRNKNLGEAIKLAGACYRTAVVTKNSRSMAKALNLLATLKDETGLHEEAAKYFQRALQYFIQVGDTLSQVVVLNNLGNVYSGIDDLIKAGNCYDRSLALASRIENDYWIHGAILGIASLQLKLKQYQEAEGNFETIVHYAEENHDHEMLLECYKNIGVCKLKTGDLLAAEGYQLMVLDLTLMMDDEIGQADGYARLGEIYMLKKDLKECFSALKNALRISQRNNYNEGLLLTWKALSDYYKESKNFDEAYIYLAKHDSAMVQKGTITVDDQKNLWEENYGEEENSKASVLSAMNIFQFILIGALILILLVVLKRMPHEQKG